MGILDGTGTQDNSGNMTGSDPTWYSPNDPSMNNIFSPSAGGGYNPTPGNSGGFDWSNAGSLFGNSGFGSQGQNQSSQPAFDQGQGQNQGQGGGMNWTTQPTSQPGLSDFGQSNPFSNQMGFTPSSATASQPAETAGAWNGSDIGGKNNLNSFMGYAQNQLGQQQSQGQGQGRGSQYNFNNDMWSGVANPGQYAGQFGFNQISGDVRNQMQQAQQSRDWTAQLPPMWQAAMRNDPAAKAALGWDSAGPSGAPDFVRNPKNDQEWQQRWNWLGSNSGMINNQQDAYNRQVGAPAPIDARQFMGNVYSQRNGQRLPTELGQPVNPQDLAGLAQKYGYSQPNVPTYNNLGQAMALANNAGKNDPTTDFYVTPLGNGQFTILTRPNQQSPNYHPLNQPQPMAMPQQQARPGYAPTRYAAPSRYSAPAQTRTPGPAPVQPVAQAAMQALNRLPKQTLRPAIQPQSFWSGVGNTLQDFMNRTHYNGAGGYEYQ